MDPSHVEQQEEIQPPEGNVPDLELLQNPSNTTHLDENPETRRVRDLTEKGKGAFTEKRDKFCQELEALWADIESQLLEVTTPPNDLQQLLAVQDKLVKACYNYRRLTDEYLDFLKRTRTLESQKEIDACKLSLDLRLSQVELAMEKLHEHRLALTKAKSTKTKTSRGSNVRRTSPVRQNEMEQEASRKQAEMEQEVAQRKQEAMRRKAQMQQEAARVSREKAELKAKFNLLEAQREAAAAEAEARILEYDDSQAYSDLPDEKEDPLQRVQDFVNKLPVSTVVKEVTGPQKKKTNSC
ncbi:merlin-like [Mytilus edulis]|uniref:merlin-like n=1 Tax=Mytilus edulis TaxID=6550 RepID=UPI0039F0D0AF